jgi:hypothetical protein
MVSFMYDTLSADGKAFCHETGLALNKYMNRPKPEFNMYEAKPTMFYLLLL